MRKTSVSTNTGASVKDWMLYRPYPNFTNYDGYYLRLANQVFDWFANPTSGFSKTVERSDLRNLSVILTCHFEDFVNEIGLWAALRRKNEQLYGRPIPIFELDGYDSDYLNPQDFCYLIWQSLGKMTSKTFDPFNPGLLAAGDFCFDFFESKIDAAPTTDFYDKWLVFDKNLHFFELKTRMKWMAFDNYLLVPAFSMDFADTVEETFKDKSGISKMANPAQLIYTLQEDYLWKKKSHWCGMSAPEWLAEIARCPDADRDPIRQTEQRAMGTFLFEKMDERHYFFKVIRTGRVFKIHRESVTISVKKLNLGSTASLMTLIFWQNDWWMSGTFMAWEFSPRDIEKERFTISNVNFYTWSEAEQQKIRELCAEMEADFIEYFGKRLVIFPNEKAMNAALKSQNDWHNQRKSKSSEPSVALKKYQELHGGDSFNFEQERGMDGARGAAAFFSPDEGMMMSTLIPELAHHLSKKNLSSKESNELFYSFFKECEPGLAATLLEQFGSKNLRHPMKPDDPDFVRDNFLLFQHYYYPEGLAAALPKMSLLPEE